MKIAIIALLIALALMITGCGTTTTDSLQASNPLVCENPYIIFNNDCCLDSNNNGLCDKDEIPKDKAPELSPGPAVSERCDGGSKMQCVGYSIGVDEISIKLQSTSKDIINIHKVILPSLGCSADFKSTADMKYNDVQDINIPCKVTHTTIDSDIVINAESKIVKIKNTGEIYDITAPTPIEMQGHISGVVKIT